jgi:hypothetical protein
MGLSPYIGLGLAHGKEFVTVDGASRNYQFALTYGLQVRYRISLTFTSQANWVVFPPSVTLIHMATMEVIGQHALCFHWRCCNPW